MIRNTMPRLLCLSAVVFLATVGARCQAQAGTELLSAAANAGATNTIAMQIVANASLDNGAVVGSFHIQTTAGYCDSSFTQMETWTSSKNVKYASGVAVGYFTPATGGVQIPTEIEMEMMTSAGNAGLVSVTLVNYYTRAAYYVSGPLKVVQGYVAINVP